MKESADAFAIVDDYGFGLSGCHTLVQLFSQTVRRCPHNLALVDGKRTFSYSELDEVSDTLAGRLAARAVGQESIVGVCLERSAELLISFLAILKAGGAYLPLDPEYPKDRLGFMIGDSRAELVIAQQSTLHLLDTADTGVLILDDATTQVVGCNKTAAIDQPYIAPAVQPQNLAYVIYTSGSTGKPKGVGVNHAGATNCAYAAAEAREFSRDQVALSCCAIGFDASIFEWIPVFASASALVLGGKGYPSPRDLEQLISDKGISNIFLPPALLSRLDETVLDVAVIGVGGDVCTPDIICRFADRAKLINCYGPTEATIFATAGRLLKNSGMDIGVPARNSRVYIVDALLNQVPCGTPGEILIGGPQVARGYLGHASAKNDCFIADPFSGEAGARLYRTGDLGQWREDGRLAFLGRIDNQTKIRGMRVEPREIEATLLKLDGIVEAAVVAQQSGDGAEADTRLVAFFVRQQRADRHDCDSFAARAPNADNTNRMRAKLARTLPRHMVPARFGEVLRLPVLPSGKVDRRLLSGMEIESPEAQQPPPLGVVERLIAELFEEVLKTVGINRNDSFFDLGGHSLAAIEIAERYRDRTGKTIRISDIFNEATVAGIASLVERGEDVVDDTIPLEKSGEALTEPFSLSHVQQAYYIGRQGAGGVGDVSCFAFTAFDFPDLDVQRLALAFNKVVSAHPALRTVFLENLSQKVLERVPAVEIPVTDYSNLHHHAAEEAWSVVVENWSHRILPADRWPLFELNAVRMPGNGWRLAFGLDLLAADAVSLEIILDQVFALYFGTCKAISTPELTFRDVVLWREKCRESSAYSRARDYWMKRLPDLPPAPVLPAADKPGCMSGPTRFYCLSYILPGSSWRRLQKRASTAGLTETVVLATAYCEVLARWSAMDDFLLNVTLMDRKSVDDEIWSVVGDFTTVSLLAAENMRRGSFKDRGRRIQKQLARDLDHAQFSGVEVLRALGRNGNRETGPHAVFTSTLGVAADSRFFNGYPEYGVTPRCFSAQTPQVLLDCIVYEDPDGISIRWNAPIGKTPEAVLNDMFQTFVKLVEDISADERCLDAPVSPWLPKSQLDLFEKANSEELPKPEGWLQDGVFRACERTPMRPALLGLTGGGDLDGGRSLSFGEMCRRALVLSNDILEELEGEIYAGLRPVAILARKGWEQVVCTLAILEAGTAFLPLSPDQPVARLAAILNEAKVGVVVCDSVNEQLAADLVGACGCNVVGVNLSRLAIGRRAVRRFKPAAPVSPSVPAYVIFTSGTTGKPKGVVVSHFAARTTLNDMMVRFALGVNDRVLWVSDLNFDLSVFDLFGVMGGGGAVVLPEPGSRENPILWPRTAERHGVTIWNSVPQLAEMAMVEAVQHSLPDLRLILLSGDWIPLSLPELIRKVAPNCEVFSLGGATEAAIWSIYYPVGPVDPAWPSIPYGRAMSNQKFHVLDRELRPCPVSVAGRLHISGDGLADGYLNDENRTSEKFITDPETGERLYDTGDLGRYLPSGDIEFLGRDDFQVKISGHRIELGEIVAVLQTHPKIETALVSAVGERENKRLVAHVIRPRSTSGGAEKLIAQGPENTSDASTTGKVGIITDKAGRISFTLAGHGRAVSDREPAVVLPGKGFSSERTAAFLARQSYRKFEGGPLDRDRLERWLASSLDDAACPKRQLATLDDFGALLGCLQAMPVDGSILSKRLYPSAGGLYPVRAYVHLEKMLAARLGLEAGSYVYDPVDHALVKLPSAAGTVRSSLLVLVGHLPAIEPLYGAWSSEACALEAGGIAAALETVFPCVQPGDVQASYLPEDLRGVFGLGPASTDLILSTFELDLSAVPSNASRCDPKGVEACFGRSGGNIAAYLWVKADAAAGLSGGVYRFDGECGLVPAHGEGLGEGDVSAINVPILERAGFAVALIQEAAGAGCGNASSVAVRLGFLAYRLAQVGVESAIGTCAVGGTSVQQFRKAFALPAPPSAKMPKFYLLLGGMIDPAQTKIWNPVEMDRVDSRDPLGVRDWLVKRLPGYMIPQAVLVIDQFPLDARGKVDRSALPQPEDLSVQLAYQPPETENERIVASAFSELLGLEQVGRNGNFFDLGGHSARMVQLVTMLERASGKRISIKDVFDNPVVCKLAGVLSETQYASKVAAQRETNAVGTIALAPNQLYFCLNGEGLYNETSCLLKGLSRGGEKGVAARMKTLSACHALLLTSIDLETRTQTVHGEWDADLLYYRDVHALDSKARSFILEEWRRRSEAADRLCVRALVLAGFKGEMDLLCFRASAILSDKMSLTILAGDMRTLFCVENLIPSKAAFSEWAKDTNNALANSTNTPDLVKSHLDATYEFLCATAEVTDYAGTQSVTIASETTERLVEANLAFGTNTIDLVAAALARALETHTGKPLNTIVLECDGRSFTGNKAAFTRVAGNFRVCRAISLFSAEDMGIAICLNKEYLNSSPLESLGLVPLCNLENYVRLVLVECNSESADSDLDANALIDETRRNEGGMTISCRIGPDGLDLVLETPESLRVATELTKSYRMAFEEIIAYCLSQVRAGEMIPSFSDFPDYSPFVRFGKTSAGGGNPVFIFPPRHGGSESHINNLAPQLGTTGSILLNNFYFYLLNLDPYWSDGPMTLEVLAAQYVALIKRIQPSGPYRFFGWSFGGYLALEAATQIREYGEGIEKLVLVDTQFELQTALAEMKKIQSDIDQSDIEKILYDYNRSNIPLITDAEIILFKARKLDDFDNDDIAKSMSCNKRRTVIDLRSHYISETEDNYLRSVVISDNIKIRDMISTHTDWVNSHDDVTAVARAIMEDG
ncbi:non-ribosomal peptide synthetase [Roseibium sp. RKSG952]|uniref:non-ribosomal peptide synthetase n=1 Tax=Roseibium sp. RKSG952 TaxID=2529384 RepID=UPI0018AD17D3|nr:non-ribosomal peptide synthetase [Roseibium sp. RKSG952]